MGNEELDDIHAITDDLTYIFACLNIIDSNLEYRLWEWLQEYWEKEMSNRNITTPDYISKMIYKLKILENFEEIVFYNELKKYWSCDCG